MVNPNKQHTSMEMKHTPRLRIASLLLALCATVLSVAAPLASAQSAGPNLIENGDFEVLASGELWPEKWGKPKAGEFTMGVEDGKNFLTLRSTEPGSMVLLYRIVFLKPDVKAVELSCRARVTGLEKGDKSWFDARIMADFLTGPGGSKVKGAKAIVFGKNTDGWEERKVVFKVPEGAKAIQIMPCLFNVKAGQIDFSEVALRAVPAQ